MQVDVVVQNIYARGNAVTLVWGSLRLAPIKNT